MNEKKYLENNEYNLLEQIIPMNENLKKCSREGYTGCIDWLSCTFDCFDYEPDNSFVKPRFDSVSTHKLKKLLAFFGKYNCDINLLDCENGTYGFKGRIQLQEGISLLIYGPLCSNGVPATSLNISGQGCHYLMKDMKNCIDLIKYLLDNGNKFTRCDLAIDNFTENFGLETISKLIKDEFYVSFSKKGFLEIGTLNKKSKYGYDGLTYNLGDRVTSDVLLRIYAKNFEQNCEKEIPNWTRFEIQINDHVRIRQVLLLLVIAYEQNHYFDFFNFVAGFLYEILQFKTPTQDTNKSRWTDNEEYLEFLNHVKKIPLFASPKNQSDFEISLDWFKRSCSLFLIKFYLIYGYDRFFDFIKYIIIRKFDDFKSKDFDFIQNARAFLGVEPLEERDILSAINRLKNELGSQKFTAFEGDLKVAKGVVLKKEEKEEDEEESMI